MKVNYKQRYQTYIRNGMHPAVAAVQAHQDEKLGMCACEVPK